MVEDAHVIDKGQGTGWQTQLALLINICILYQKTYLTSRSDQNFDKITSVKQWFNRSVDLIIFISRNELFINIGYMLSLDTSTQTQQTMVLNYTSLRVINNSNIFTIRGWLLPLLRSWKVRQQKHHISQGLLFHHIVVWPTWLIKTWFTYNCYN